MFDRTYSEEDEPHFNVFKFKVLKHPRPAWDFQNVLHNPRIGLNSGFKGRIIGTPFANPEDCEHE